MKTIIKFILNFFASIIFILMSSFFFIFLQLFAILSPVLVGGLIAYLLNQTGDNFRPIVTLFSVASPLASFLILLSTFKVFYIVIRNKKPDGITYNKTIFELVKSVTADFNTRQFKTVILSTKLSFGTFPTLFGRYLVLDLLALKFLTKKETMGIIAHEIAHFQQPAMQFYRAWHRTYTFNLGLNSSLDFVDRGVDLLPSSNTFAVLGKAIYISIFINRLFLKLFGLYVEEIGKIIGSKKVELQCDLVAAKYVGSEILTSALMKLYILKIAIKHTLENEEFISRNEWYIRTVENFFNELKKESDPELIADMTSRLPIYPSLQTRIDKINSTDFTQKDDSGSKLFSDDEFMRFWRESSPQY